MKIKIICGVVLSTILLFNVYDISALDSSSKLSSELLIEKNCKVGWKKVESDWYYINKDGNYKKGWLLDKGKWYYLDLKDGKMIKGRIEEINDKNYYFNKDGSMSVHKGWKQISYDYGFDTYTTWIYLNGDGTCKIGWFYEGEKWYYFSEWIDSGRKDIFMQEGLATIEDKLYYFESDGSLSTNKGWKKYVDKYEKEYNTWYYLNGDGTCKVGWVLDDGKCYYWNTYGDFYFNGSYKINDKYYEFDINGVCTNPY